MVLGATNECTLTSLEWLGRSLYYLEEYAKAEAVFQQAFKGCKMILGETHEHTLTSLEWLGRSIHYSEE